MSDIYSEMVQLQSILASKKLPSYDTISIDTKITIKALINMDKATMSQFSHRSEWTELQLLQCVEIVSNWKFAINLFILKYMSDDED